MIITAVLFILMILVLLIPHEGAHMLVAKLCGVRVLEFSVGMGPLIVQRQKGDTMYSLRLIPLGGYCAMEGADEDSDDPAAFNNKTLWQKIAIMLAGVVANIIIAIVIITIVFMINGVPVNTVANVTENMPAYEAGMQVGDRIVEIDGKRVHSWSETTEAVNNCEEGDSLEIVVKRDGANKSLVISPIEEDGSMLIGVECAISRNPMQCLRYGIPYGWYMFKQLLNSFKQLFTGQLSSQDVAGPVGIVRVVDQAKSYGVQSYLLLLALVSINLAIFNLLPIPSLDGGKILIAVVRALTGKAITDEMEARINLAGMMFLLFIVIILTFNDIVNILK